VNPEQIRLSLLAEKALQEAVKKVIDDARRKGRTLVVWEQGAVRYIPADQLPAASSPTGDASTQGGV
jgi:hypothetical protein